MRIAVVIRMFFRLESCTFLSRANNNKKKKHSLFPAYATNANTTVAKKLSVTTMIYLVSRESSFRKNNISNCTNSLLPSLQQ